MAFDGTLVDAEGKAVKRAHVAVSGRPGSAQTDSEGRFSILPDPELPATLIVTGERGEVYPPIRIDTFPAGEGELRLDPFLRESVTVMSGASPAIEAPPGVATTVIGQEEVEQRKPQHLVDAVERIPGVSRRGEGPQSVPVVRGLAGGRTLLMVDDSRIVAERRAGPSGTFLNPFGLASIEIARGPGSVAYGSDALGGIIHARPRDPVPGAPETRFDLWGSSESQEVLSGAIEVSHDLAGGAFLISAHGRLADDSTAGNGESIINSSYEDRGASLRFVSSPSWGRWRIAFAADQAREVGAPASDSNINRTYYPEENSYRLTAGADLSDRWGFSALEVRGSLGRYEIVTNRERLPVGATTRQISSAAVDARDATLRIQATKLSKAGRLLTGLDYVTRFGLEATGQTRGFDAAGNPTTTSTEVSIEDADKHDLGLFAIYEHRVGHRLMASGGIRTDAVKTRNRGGYFGKRSTDDIAVSGHIALMADLPLDLDASLKASIGYREPSLSDRYFRGISGRGFVTGSPELDPERSFQVDFALRRTGRRHSIAFFAYDYRIHDLVERFRNGNDFFFRNRGEAEIRGVELEGEARFPLGITLQAGAALARGEAVHDEPLDDIAAPTLHVTFRKGGARSSVFISALALGRDDRPGPVETERPGYVTVDLGGGWHFTKALELRLLLRNATDRFYAGSSDASASAAPGRSVAIGVNGKL